MADRTGGGGVTTAYATDFERVTRAADAKWGWLAALRQSAQARFEATGFPSVKHEDWRFNNLAPLTSASFPLAPSSDAVTLEELAPFLYPIPGVTTLVFVNGCFAPELSSSGSLPAGVTARSLAAAMSTHGKLIETHLGKYSTIEQNGFTALNTAFLKDGLFLHVPKQAEMQAPVHAIFVSDSAASASATHPRNLIVVESGARGAVIESYIGLTPGHYFTNAVSEVVVEANGYLEHTRIQRESEKAFHIGTTHFHQGRDSRVHSSVVSFGAALGRSNLDMTLDGEGIESTLLGMYMGRGTQELDNHTSILHSHPNCGTREVYKGILDDKSHGVFNGKIYVTPEAQKTDAKQTNRVLLLSDTASIDTKPQLEIFADDVKCTHGATVGALDPMARFYLQSRGIGGDLARRVLTYAFAAEILEELPYEELKTKL
ncbi:MAG TPA: Fe-S cluster assembly protein SufD, partial [Gemmatimonadales bacterium]|nr:Fe-S cluster assembly protein SufD [Gemmatimonadales bacterium]